MACGANKKHIGKVEIDYLFAESADFASNGQIITLNWVRVRLLANTLRGH